MPEHNYRIVYKENGMEGPPMLSFGTGWLIVGFIGFILQSCCDFEKEPNIQ